MRDTELLRRRLWAHLGLPLATTALLSACDGGAQVEPVKVTKVEAEAGDNEDAAGDSKAEIRKQANTKNRPKPRKKGLPEVQVNGYVPPARIEDIPEGEFDYFGPARDPFTDHAEEDGCPSGDWCGSPEDARKFTVKHIPEQLGCPAKIIAQPQVTNSLDKEDKKWDGLSFHPMMQGRLVSSVTKETREKGKDEDICCYHWFEYCSGRPLLDGENIVVAELRAGAGWSCEPELVAAPPDRPDSGLSEAIRGRLADAWANDGLMEHAAIAAFERATLELMAMAAPPQLLAEVQAAAADEVDHATHCFGLAARFSGLEREPGPLASLEPRVRGLADRNDDADATRRDWVRLALDTFVEGCVGETIATLIARRSQRHCEDPATHALLERIVDDEGRHAGLAWQTIEWILDDAADADREAVVEALTQQAEAMAAKARTDADAQALPAADPDAAILARYGRCDRRAELLARRDAWTELILPTLAALTHTGADGQDPIART